MDMRKDEPIRYQLSPKFNFIYELFMPTGRKMKTTMLILFVFFVFTVYILFAGKTMQSGEIILFGNVSVLNLLTYSCLLIDILLIVKLIFHIIFQNLQYKHITYTFYDSHMIYEDDFLNQHRKNIEYANVKEVEIRRTIMDRIFGYGVIIIYTNAENNRSNGLVIYGIKNPKNSYDIIDQLVHKGKDKKIEEITKEEKIEKQQNINEEKMTEEQYASEEERLKRIEEEKRKEEDFLNSLKDVEETENTEEH